MLEKILHHLPTINHSRECCMLNLVTRTWRDMILANSPSAADRALRMGVASWLTIALVGQWIFACYIFIVYAIPVAGGDFALTRLSHPITGYVESDTMGNVLYFSHVIPAAILSMAGVLQIIPALRQQYPVLHRWSGRLFLSLGLCGAIGGLYLTWGRDSRLSDFGAIGITLNGLLIPIAVYLAWHYARLRRFAVHRRWAIQAFLLVNGVWTFRLYLMGWYIINQGPNGNTKQLDGPADIVLSFACYLLPMAVSGLVFWAEHKKHTILTWGVSGIMMLGSIITLFGVIAATFAMWMPPIQAVLAA